ncbi:MAG: acetate kinase, partial [Erysipelotrichaceae bacterium]|nr:acetate kinase [Erysipelotrichaceae bacterium]
GQAERIGQDIGVFTINVNGEKVVTEAPIKDHQAAVDMLLEALIKHGIVKDLNEIEGAGHRVVQGGDYYSESVKVDESVVKNVDELCALAPLHNKAHLICYEAFKKALPHIGHVFVFDTAFHQTMPEQSYLYPVPYEWYKDLKVRKYGAHGTSHQYVMKRTAELMGKDYKELNIITCHLGNGASITAIKNGKVYNTSMGLSPLGGVMMGTRCGDIDPTVVYYVEDKLGLSPKQMETELNKKSGMLGVSGVSSDSRDVEAAFQAGNPRAITTQKLYAQRVVDFIGSYYMELGHVDAIAFTAGLGEHAVEMRERVLKTLEEPIGVRVDYELNKKTHSEAKLSTPDSKIEVWVVPTNEELCIARDTVRILGL